MSKQYCVAAVEKAIKILNFLAEYPGSSFSEIFTALDLSKSTTYQTLSTLEMYHYIVREENRRYSLDLGLLPLLRGIPRRNDLVECARRPLERLAADTGFTVHLCTLTESHNAICVYKVDGVNFTIRTTAVGRELTLHTSAAGKALLAWLDVRHLGGELLLRMEDLDPDRCRPEYLSQLADDLIWLGLDWDLGWRPGETAYCQSCRTPFYQAAFKTLASRGLVYPCYCSRKERLAASAPHAADGARIYSGRCRRLSAQEKTALQESGRSPAWRVQVPGEIISFVDEVFGPQQERLDRDCGDFILRRSDGIYAYQLAVAEDDGRMGVTRVVRGWDLLSSTPRQIWLLEQLGYSVPTYCHVPLLKSPAGRRLSKRDRDLDMGYLRAHTTPEKLVGLLAYLAGLIPRPTALRPSDLVPEFSWSKVGQADRIVDDGIWEAL